MKLGIITNGAFPVPASKGGAVEALTEWLLDTNEVEKRADLTLFSVYDEEAKKMAERYKVSKVKFIEPSGFSKVIDSILHFIAYNIFHSKRHLAFKTTFQRLDYLYKVAKELNRDSFDKILVENQLASLMVFKYRNNLSKYKGKFYFHLHNHPAKYLNLEILKQCKKVISVSEFIGNAFAKNIKFDYYPGQLAVVKNMVDENLFNPKVIDENELDKIRADLSLHGKKVVLFLGRLIPGKGVKELLQAFKLLNHDEMVLLIVGSFNYNFSEHSVYEDDLNALINELGEERVKFTGYVPHNKVANYYSLADIVVLPSTCEDAAPLTVIETLMMHKPLITTSMGGIPEYASGCAVLLDNNEQLVENLAVQIQSLIFDEVRKKQMSEKAETISADWTLAKFYNDIIDQLN